MGVKKLAKAKLPKRLGGVKLPKEVRKAGGRLVKAAASPAGRELIAAGLGLAATAAAAAVERDRLRRAAAAATGRNPDMVPDATAGAKPGAAPRAAGSDPHDIGVQLGRMAEAALANLFGAKRG